MGWITLNSCRLENTLEERIWELLKQPDAAVAGVLTAQLSFRAKVDLLGALQKARSTDTALNEETDRLLREALAKEEARNQVIHSYWSEFEPGDSAMRVKRTARRRGLRTDEEVMTPEALFKISNEIADLEERIRSATLV